MGIGCIGIQCRGHHFWHGVYAFPLNLHCRGIISSVCGMALDEIGKEINLSTKKNGLAVFFCYSENYLLNLGGLFFDQQSLQ